MGAISRQAAPGGPRHSGRQGPAARRQEQAAIRHTGRGAPGRVGVHLRLHEGGAGQGCPAQWCYCPRLNGTVLEVRGLARLYLGIAGHAQRQSGFGDGSMRSAGLLAHVVLAAAQRLVAVGIAGMQALGPVRCHRIDFRQGDDAVLSLSNDSYGGISFTSVTSSSAVALLASWVLEQAPSSKARRKREYNRKVATSDHGVLLKKGGRPVRWSRPDLLREAVSGLRRMGPVDHCRWAAIHRAAQRRLRAEALGAVARRRRLGRVNC